jgi:hypothetical protein
MKFTKLLSQVIVEASKMDFLLNRYGKNAPKGPKLNEKLLVALISADPTTRKATESPKDINDIKKAGNYSEWIIKQFLGLAPEDLDPKQNPGLYKRELDVLQDRFFEDLYKVTSDLTKFDRLKNRIPQEFRDINKLNVKTLFDVTKDLSLEMATTTKKERKEAPVHPGAKLLFDGSRFQVIKIEGTGDLQKEAAFFYGGNHEYDKGETRWCTSSPGLHYWNTHLSQGPLFVILDKSDGNLTPVSGLPKTRYQWHFQTNQFMDRHDGRMEVKDFLLGDAKELLPVFKKEFAANLSKKSGGDNVELEINYPRDSSALYITLYGWDELLQAQPEGLQKLMITNSSNENLNLNLTNELKRFKSLYAILLDKVVTEFPKILCEMNSLEYISIPDTPQITEVPECLVDLPNLEALALPNSSSDIKIPERLKAKFWENGGPIMYIGN